MESEKGKGVRGIRRTQLDQEISSGEIDKLPYEIISNILSKLPITSVFQCRCVCKSWLKIVHDPRFAYAHLGRSTTPYLWCRTCVTITPSNTLYLVEPYTFKYSNKITWIPKATDLRTEAVGSCNGLICLAQTYNYVVVYVCNPFTRQYMELPQSAHYLRRKQDSAVLGFGFASKTKEYKVVKMIPDFLDGVRTSHVEVYTLGTGCWRSKGTISYTLNLCRHWHAFLNGALHWMSSNHNSVLDEVIVSFDVGNEEFRVIPHPEFNPANVDTRRHVGVIEGCLSLYNYSSRGCIEIWIMKDYGVKESWSKYFVFSEGHHDFYPLDMHRNGESILGYSLGKMVTYDVASQKLRDIQVYRFDLVYPFVASLITLESACGGEKMSETERSKIKGKKMSSCTYINQLPDGAKLRVHIKNGKLIRDHAIKLSYWCGCLARDGRLLPIDCSSWRNFDNATKDRVWKMVLEKFDFDEEMKHHVMQSLSKKWRDNKGKLKAKYYDNCVASEDGYAQCPPTVIPDQWQTLINFWDSKQGKKRSERNKQNCSHQTLPHTAETKSFTRVNHEKMQEASQDLTSQNDVFS